MVVVERVEPEIEKKFIVDKPPKKFRKQYKSVEIVQGYTEEGVRYRKAREGEKVVYTRTIKVGRGVVRTEHERSIKSHEFKKVWDSTKDRRLKKTRYFIPYEKDGKVVPKAEIHLDILHKNGKKRKLKGKVVAEVEFKTVEMSGTFIAPEWFRNRRGEAREVTGLKEYSCRSLATKGWPKKRK